ncbi:MAG: GNAT family N-acetyltransferase [Parvibaculaceae bacterium]|nr:GNAT family N-acetyltransferase [Parvibaculaceae bacterium]
MIREFISRDTDAVVDAWQRASHLAHPFLTPAFLAQEAHNVRHIYVVHAETWVAEVSGQVVGFVALVPTEDAGEDVWEVGGLFLDPAFHGQGIGKALMDKAVADKGPLKVEVFQRNSIGRRFYAAYGFVASGEYFHEASDQMTLQLNYSPN